MALPRAIPALADLTQDIAGPVPVQLLRDWATGQQDLAAAETLLDAFRVKGAVVVSDTSGLSRMMKEMDLLEVLSLISRPKQIIHALGREVGGRAIGSWVADNTEMFYAEDLAPETIVEAMAEVQARIQERHAVQVGMCIHAGSFYEIGGGLYGADADTVEYLAEHCADPGEILLTENVARRLHAAGHGDGPSNCLTLQPVSLENVSEQAYTVQWNRRAPWLRENETAYPHAFPPEFYKLLCQFTGSEELRRRIYDQWLQECTVVFLARQRGPGEAGTLNSMLDDLVINALMDALIRETMAASSHIAASAGGLAILTFDTAQEGIGFARDVRAKLAENGLPVQVAIDTGPVLLFRNARGPGGIAGDPVNTASKLAEDLGVSGSISITERAFARMTGIPGADRFELTVSGIILRGVFLS